MNTYTHTNEGGGPTTVNGCAWGYAWSGNRIWDAGNAWSAATTSINTLVPQE